MCMCNNVKLGIDAEKLFEYCRLQGKKTLIQTIVDS
jgi:hypothetical protein